MIVYLKNMTTVNLLLWTSEIFTVYSTTIFSQHLHPETIVEEPSSRSSLTSMHWATATSKLICSDTNVTRCDILCVCRDFTAKATAKRLADRFSALVLPLLLLSFGLKSIPPSEETLHKMTTFQTDPTRITNTMFWLCASAPVFCQWLRPLYSTWCITYGSVRITAPFHQFLAAASFVYILSWTDLLTAYVIDPSKAGPPGKGNRPPTRQRVRRCFAMPPGITLDLECFWNIVSSHETLQYHILIY